MPGIVVTEEQEIFIAERAHLSTRGLSRLMVEEYGSNIELWRSIVRYRRGEKGMMYREKAARNGKLQGTTKYTCAAPVEKTFKPFPLPPIGRGLVVGDLHLPYHDQAAVDTAINYAIDNGCTDHLTILGDLSDFYGLSYFNRDPRSLCLEECSERSTKFLEDMTGIFKRVIFKAGNHDLRLELYIWSKAPELAGLRCLSLPEMLDLQGLGIDYVSAYDPIYAGDNLTLIHGHEYGRGMFSPVNAARGLFIRTLACAISAHHHRTSHHDEPDVRGRDISTWSIGCLCDLHPRYAPLNKWNHGFGVLNFQGDDDWDFSNHRIVNGHVR